jgi:hypothetical protein
MLNAKSWSHRPLGSFSYEDQTKGGVIKVVQMGKRIGPGKATSTKN